MARRIEPELLDALPPDDLSAIGSRRDLRRINIWMRQAGIMARLLRDCGLAGPRSILELGAGDGTFMLDVARRLGPSWAGAKVRLVDRQDLVATETRHAFASLGWIVGTETADILDEAHDCLRTPVDIVTANLFLHHFRPAELSALLMRVAGCASYLAACEPRRSSLALAGSRMIFAIGCNAVSRHDAVVSVRAGFRDSEVSDLWPGLTGGDPIWRVRERPAGLFTHTILARRDVQA